MSIEIKGLCKSFSVPVLKGINLKIKAGSIHGLVGENGAGKSTLINILNGFLKRDEGDIWLDGKIYNPKGVKCAMAEGFSLAAQELSLIQHLSIAENVVLKKMPHHYGVLNGESILNNAKQALENIGLIDVELSTPVSQLSLAQKQLVELAKALLSAKKLLILDEPTAALTGPQAERLHEVIRERAAQGTSVIYVSHRLQDVLDVCDTVSVLRDGEIQLTAESKDLNTQMLIELMSGRTFTEHKAAVRTVSHKPRIVVSNLTTKVLPHKLNFTCYSGEILGVAGLAGAGRSELLEAIYGLTSHTSGSVCLMKDDKSTFISSSRAAVKNGMAFVAEDRKTQGIFADKSIAMNTTIANLSLIANTWGVLRHKFEQQRVQLLIDNLQVKCEGPEQAINKLSGGNQQKLLIGRWMQAGSNVLLLDEPTRGVDPTSKQSIHDRLRTLSDEGASMIVVSSDIDELVALCDRILVLSERKHVATFSRGEWSHDAILQAAFSEHTAVRSA